MDGSVRRIIAVAVVVAMLALALVVVRVWFASRAEWRAGEALVAQYNRREAVPGPAGEDPADRRRALLRDAIVRFREAALWYLPANPYARRAIDRLLLIGQRAEQAADDALALYAYRAARSGTLGARSFFIPDEEGLARADRAIARVSARLDRPPAPGKDMPTLADREQRHLALLEPPSEPEPWLAVLAALGLLAWVGGGIGFAVRGLDDQCRVRLGAAWRAGIVVVCGLAAWVAGLALA